jgi:hypothetical protein
MSGGDTCGERRDSALLSRFDYSFGEGRAYNQDRYAMRWTVYEYYL